jgi:hypothetical protein
MLVTRFFVKLFSRKTWAMALVAIMVFTGFFERMGIDHLIAYVILNLPLGVQSILANNTRINIGDKGNDQ